MSKIKLLYATGNNTGGALKHVIDLATHLDREKFEISAVLTKKNQIFETRAAIAKLRNCHINVKHINMNRMISLMDIVALINICNYSATEKYKKDEK
jgi:hypothetical protein